MFSYEFDTEGLWWFGMMGCKIYNMKKKRKKERERGKERKTRSFQCGGVEVGRQGR